VLCRESMESKTLRPEPAEQKIYYPDPIDSDCAQVCKIKQSEINPRGNFFEKTVEGKCSIELLFLNSYFIFKGISIDVSTGGRVGRYALLILKILFFWTIKQWKMFFKRGLAAELIWAKVLCLLAFHIQDAGICVPSPPPPPPPPSPKSLFEIDSRVLGEGIIFSLPFYLNLVSTTIYIYIQFQYLIFVLALCYFALLVMTN